MTTETLWTAERSAHPNATADGWAVVYNPTPGGRDNGDGTRSYSMRFPALLICDMVSAPEKVAREVADLLNASEAARKEHTHD